MFFYQRKGRYGVTRFGTFGSIVTTLFGMVNNGWRSFIFLTPGPGVTWLRVVAPFVFVVYSGCFITVGFWYLFLRRGIMWCCGLWFRQERSTLGRVSSVLGRIGGIRFVNVNNTNVYPLTRVLVSLKCRIANSSGGSARAFEHIRGRNTGIFLNRGGRGVSPSARLIVCAGTVLGNGRRLRFTGTGCPAFRETRLLKTVDEVCSGYVNIYNARNGAAASSVVARTLLRSSLSPDTIVNKGLPVVGTCNEINGARGFIYRSYRFGGAFLRVGTSVTIILGVSRSRLSFFKGLRGVGGSFHGFYRGAAGAVVCGNSSTGAISVLGNVSNGRLVSFNGGPRGR